MDPRILRSRQALHRAFLELLEKKSLDQITIRDIADQSGVGYTPSSAIIPARRQCSVKSSLSRSSTC
jgi:hypothetical protein